MEDVIRVAISWLHHIAFVGWLGYFFSSAIVFTPLTRRHIPLPAQADFLIDYIRRVKVITFSAVGLFGATGTWLLLTDEEYEGLGNFFVNPWTTLISIKHIFVLALVALAVYLLYFLLPRLVSALRELAGKEEPAAAEAALVARLNRRHQLVISWLAILGAGILLIIAIASAEH